MHALCLRWPHRGSVNLGPYNTNLDSRRKSNEFYRLLTQQRKRGVMGEIDVSQIEISRFDKDTEYETTLLFHNTYNDTN